MLMAKAIPHYFLYGEEAPIHELEFLHIETIADRNQLHHWEIEPHRHDNLLQIVFIEEGYIKSNIDTSEMNCYGPAIVSIPPTVVHGFKSQPGTKGYVLTIAESFLQQISDTIEQDNFAQLRHTPKVLSLDPHTKITAEIASTIRTIDNEFRWPQSGRMQLISAYLNILMIQIGRLPCPTENKNMVSTQQFKQMGIFKNFRSLVDHHYKEHWSVQRYAQHMGMSEGRLNTLCRKIVDLSPSQIIHNRMIIEAKRNLAYTSMPVSVIAYELGFKDPAYFSRYFAKQVGTAASSFRDEYTD